jgi:zinc transport system ATP-binding protein
LIPFGLVENFNPVENQYLVNAQSVSYELAQRKILDNISLQIAENQILTLIGPNGAGKTTLVKIVLGLLKPSSGKIVTRPNLRVGYMPQRLVVESTMPITVKKFLQLAVHTNKLLIEKSLDDVSSLPLINHQIHSLSGGELQRVLLARALIQKPQLLVLDEPAQGVDISGQAELYRLISDLRDQHQCGVLMVSHDLHLVMSATDEVVCLNQHICCHGHPESVSTDPAYLELFGKKHAEAIAVYAHHHNHSHDLAGEIVSPDKNHG